jgi:hypothetical protein
MRTRLNLVAIATAFVSLSSVGAPPDVPSNQAPGLVPPQAIVDVGNAAPLIRYNRNLPGGGHTNGGTTGGWQIAHALAVRAGNTSADAKLLEQIAYNLDGANALSANGGYPAQHELHLTGTYAIVRHVPRFWNDRLTSDQRRKIDLVMTAAMVASAYTTADATYAGGAAPTALDGDTNLHRNWNPNFREGMFGALIAAMVYFGGAEAVMDRLNRYDHAAFVRDVQRPVSTTSTRPSPGPSRTRPAAPPPVHRSNGTSATIAIAIVPCRPQWISFAS